jgi:hypothetical protein
MRSTAKYCVCGNVLLIPEHNYEYKYQNIFLRKIWRYQRGNQNPYIEEEQTTQCPKEKIQKDKQRSTKHAYKTKDRVTRTPLKTGVNSGGPEGWGVPTPLVAPVVLI